MGLKFKAPTKKSTAAAQNKNLWKSEEDEELQSLYDQYRTESGKLNTFNYLLILTNNYFLQIVCSA